MALVLIYANLQRLMVFRSSVARIEGRELDPDQRLELTSRMDLLNGVIGRSGQSRSVADGDVDVVTEIARGDRQCRQPAVGPRVLGNELRHEKECPTIITRTSSEREIR